MTDYINNFNDNTTTATMSLRANDKQLLKNYDKTWKKTERLMSIDFESKPFCGDVDDDKYIKIKIKIYKGNIMTNFH